MVWGLAFGGAATLYQTALLRAAGDAGDVVQALTTTAWNLAIAAGGGLGGLLLAHCGATVLPWALLALLLVSLSIAVRARRHGFPP